MKTTTKEWRDLLREQFNFNAERFPSGGDYTISSSDLLPLLNDADRCAELEAQHTCLFCGSRRVCHTCGCGGGLKIKAKP